MGPAKTPRKLVLTAALVMALGTLAVARQATWSRRRGPPIQTCLERLERGVSHSPNIVCRARGLHASIPQCGHAHILNTVFVSCRRATHKEVSANITQTERNTEKDKCVSLPAILRSQKRHCRAGNQHLLCTNLYTTKERRHLWYIIDP